MDQRTNDRMEMDGRTNGQMHGRTDEIRTQALLFLFIRERLEESYSPVSRGQEGKVGPGRRLTDLRIVPSALCYQVAAILALIPLQHAFDGQGCLHSSPETFTIERVSRRIFLHVLQLDLPLVVSPHSHGEGLEGIRSLARECDVMVFVSLNT